MRRRRPDPDRGPLHRPAPPGTFRIPLHQTDAITADTTSGPPAARTSSACRRAFEGQPLDGNPRLGDWRSATKSYPSGQGRNSVSDLSSEFCCRRAYFGVSLELRSGQPVFVVHARGYGRFGCRLAGAVSRRRARKARAPLVDSAEPATGHCRKAPKTNQPGATDTFVSVPVKTLGCRVTVLTAADSSGDCQRSSAMGWRPVFQLATMRELRFSSTNLVASADDNDARVEQS